MAAPTWRNVAAPDFSTSMQGMRDANNLLSNAFAGLDRTIGKVDANVSERVNNRLLAELATMSDSKTASADIKELMAGVDTSRLSADTLGVVASTPDRLLGRDMTKGQIRSQDLRYESNALDYTQRLSFDESAPVIAEIRRAVFSGDDARVAELRKQHPQIYAEMGARDVLGAEDSYTAAAAQGLDQRRGQYRFGRQVEGDQIEDAATVLREELLRNNVTNTEALAALNNRSDVAPQVASRVRSQLSLPGLMDGGNITAFTEGSGDAISDFKRMVRGVESGGNDSAKNPNSSASGRYQFVEGTFLEMYKKAYGASDNEARFAWKNNRNSPEVQEALMDQLIVDNQSSLQRAGIPVTSGSLYLAHFAGAGGAQKLYTNPNQSAEAILGEDVVRANPFLKNMTGAQVIQWAEQKAGTSPISPRQEAANSAAGDTGRAQRMNKILSNPVAMAYAENLNFTGDDREVLKDIRSDARLGDVPPSEVDTLTRSVITEARSAGVDLNYKQAFEVLRLSLKERGLLGHMFGEGSGTKYMLDRGALKENLKSLAQGTGQEAAKGLQQVQFSQQEQQAAQAQLAQARAAYNQAVSRGLPPAQIQRYKQALMQASAAVEAMPGQQLGQGDYVLYPGGR